MMRRLQRLRREVQDSFWFLPTLIVLGSATLAALLIAEHTPWQKADLMRFPRLLGAGADGARGMLTTIAGSTMTVVGVTLSMTLVVLALASSQYTSRVLRNFMRDRMTQAVLGMFAGIYVYCLIVLRTIRGGGGGEHEFVPRVAVLVGVALAIVGVAVLVYFIHHIATSIQASSIIASVADETIAAVESLFPERLGDEPAPAETPPPRCRWQAVVVERGGYIQHVDDAALLRLAREHELIVRMERGVGEFVVAGEVLAWLSLDASPSAALAGALREAYTVSRHRTVDQDAAFGIRQLVDVALRALSPGINDTTTAVMCVDHLTAILCHLASRDMPSRHRLDEGRLRVIAQAPSFASLVGEAFDQIRASGAGNAAILVRQLDSLAAIAAQTRDADRRRVLRRHLEWLSEAADRSLAHQPERGRLGRRLAEVNEALGPWRAASADGAEAARPAAGQGRG